MNNYGYDNSLWPIQYDAIIYSDEFMPSAWLFQITGQHQFVGYQIV